MSRNKKRVFSGIVVVAGLAAVYGLVALYSQPPEEAAGWQPEEVRRHVLERQRQAVAAVEARRLQQEIRNHRRL